MFVQKLTVKQNQLDYKSKSFDFMLHMHEKRIRQKSYGNVETVRIFKEAFCFTGIHMAYRAFILLTKTWASVQWIVKLESLILFKVCKRASWWLSGKKIHLPMQETWVWSLVQEDPIGQGASKPISHNYWACAPRCAGEPRTFLCSRAQELQLLSPCTTTTEAHVLQGLCSTVRDATATRSQGTTVKSGLYLLLEKSPCSNKDPSTAKN